MPKQIVDIRDFLEKARRKDAKNIKIKKTAQGVTKFKIRTSKYLYTLVLADKEKAEQILKTLPPGLEQINLN